MKIKPDMGQVIEIFVCSIMSMDSVAIIKEVLKYFYSQWGAEAPNEKANVERMYT